MRKIIAFYSPRPQVGKSTAANYLSDKYGFCSLSFADPIKKFVAGIVAKIRPCEWQEISDHKDKPTVGFNGASWRDFMIAFGQAGRSVYQNVWADIVKTEIVKNPSQNFTIDDLRFQNEYEMLKKQGAKFVRITAPDCEIIKSETECLLEDYGFDYQLSNDKNDFFEYRTQIDVMMKHLWPEENE